MLGKLVKFAAQRLGGTALDNAGTQIGTAIGNRIAKLIDKNHVPLGQEPPEPAEENEDKK